MSIGISLIMDANPKGYEVSEHIATKVKVNTWMLSTLKNKNQLKHEPRWGVIHKWLDLWEFYLPCPEEK